MPTYLALDCQIRSEIDPQTISNLTRKGWVETVPPSYDPATQQPPVWENCGWVVKPIPPPEPYRVSKDTIVSRVLAAGKLNDLIAMTAGLPEDQAYLWDNFAWFWDTNPTIVGMCQQLALDPKVILAPDPYLT